MADNGFEITNWNTPLVPAVCIRKLPWPVVSFVAASQVLHLQNCQQLCGIRAAE